MIKDKLHTITDEDAIEVATILLKSATSDIFVFTFDKITRYEYDYAHGVDAEESVNVFFNGMVKNDTYRRAGWKDKRIQIQLIESDRYHDFPYFNASRIEDNDEKVWKYEYLSNHIEAVEYLQNKKYL